MELYQLSDNEIEEYLSSVSGQTEQERRELFLSKHIKKLDTTRNLISKSGTDCLSVKNMLTIGDIQGAGKACIGLISDLNRCLSNLYVIVNNIGYKGQIESQIAEREDIRFEQMENNIFHIVFQTLLPKRITEKDGEKKHQLIHARYRNAFTDYFKDKKYRIYSEKAVFCFIHHFSSEHDIRDHDNFEIKFVIDYLAGYLLIDDSAKYCSHYMDYVMDTRDYSELFIIPDNYFIEFLQKKEWL